MNYFKAASMCLPDDWKKEDYSNQTYTLVDLDKDIVEYKEVETLCNRNGIKAITEILRIQHPFAYLRYELKMEFERIWNNSELVVSCLDDGHYELFELLAQKLHPSIQLCA